MNLEMKEMNFYNLYMIAEHMQRHFMESSRTADDIINLKKDDKNVKSS